MGHLQIRVKGLLSLRSNGKNKNFKVLGNKVFQQPKMLSKYIANLYWKSLYTFYWKFVKNYCNLRPRKRLSVWCVISAGTIFLLTDSFSVFVWRHLLYIWKAFFDWWKNKIYTNIFFPLIFKVIELLYDICRCPMTFVTHCNWVQYIYLVLTRICTYPTILFTHK